jgi:hypothetical protein
LEETVEAIEVSSKVIEEFNSTLGSVLQAANIQVTDQRSLVESGNAKISLESYVKAVKGHFDQELGPLEERVKRIKNQRENLLTPAKMALNVLVERQRTWMAEEKRRADAEAERKRQELQRQQQQKADEDRRAAEREAANKKREAVAKIETDLAAGLIGKREAAKRLKEAGAEEEAAKATAAAVAEEEKNKPAPEVRVVPSIPVVAGVKNQTFHFAEVLDAAKIVDAFASACRGQLVERYKFLERFITVDEKEVSAYAREIKDPQAVMSVLPGVKCWSKG